MSTLDGFQGREKRGQRRGLPGRDVENQRERASWPGPGPATSSAHRRGQPDIGGRSQGADKGMNEISMVFIYFCDIVNKMLQVKRDDSVAERVLQRRES